MSKPRPRKTRIIISILALASLSIFVVPRVEAANGPFNGKIAFVSLRAGNNEIFTMNANGSIQVNISNNPAQDNDPAWSPDGTRIAFHSNRDAASEIYVMNADGTGLTRLTNNSALDVLPAWSPDGTKLAFRSNRDGGNSEIYVMNADGSGQTRLTNNLVSDDNPAWSPDGTRIAFDSNRDGNTEIYVMNTDGTGVTRLTNNTSTDQFPSFSPDGTKIVFSGGIGNFQIMVMNANGTNPVQLTSSGVNNIPAFSPDGTQIAFHSNRDGGDIEIYIMNADGSNQTRLTSAPSADFAPAWQPVPKLDTIGVFRPSTGQFLLRNFNSAGSPNLIITFGQSGDQPLAGDWDGDGIDTVGVFRNGQFLLRQPRAIFGPTITVNFGQAGDLAIVGDWNGDGIDTPGVFRPSTGQFFLTNGANTNNSSPPPSLIAFNGQAGDKPVAGDWNGDDLDTVGIYRESAACAFLLSNNNFSINIIATGFCAVPPVAPVTADWNGNGVDTLGLYSVSQALFSLSNNLTGPPEFQVAFGQAGDLPVAGDWNGGNTPPDSGVNNPFQGSSSVGQIQQFITTCSDPDGWHDISTIDFKIARSDGNGNGVPIALWVQFDEASKMIRFYDPDTATWSEGEVGSAAVLSNRFAELHLAATVVLGSGPTGPSVQIGWAVLFKNAAMMNNYKQYLKITDDAGASTGFDKVGSWSVTR
jgi:hypothetical protein